MNGFRLPPWLQKIGARGNALAAPILIILLLAMMILPLPAFALDLFFSFNIAMSVIVLLTALYTVKPLDFMAFPAVLLVTTMLRLSLNVASTRVVLLHSAAFWLGRTESASRQLYEATLLFSLYPDTLFTGAMRWILFTLVPAGFVGYLPADLIRAPSAWTALARATRDVAKPEPGSAPARPGRGAARRRRPGGRPALPSAREPGPAGPRGPTGASPRAR